jgi:hypothetical protein
VVRVHAWVAEEYVSAWVLWASLTVRAISASVPGSYTTAGPPQLACVHGELLGDAQVLVHTSKLVVRPQ